MDKIADKRLFIYVGIIVALIFPALLINLGLLTYINDEAIRGLVTLEMDYSGNFIVPTVNGSFYYSKPPMYNWLIHLSFKLFGVANEFSSRFPTVVCLLLFCITIYKVNKPYFKDIKYPILIALFYLTCGRIIFWDSFRGLIDIGFSWVVYMMFIAVYHYGTKQKYWHMYIIAYVLASVAYMLKGLPAFVFVGFTIIAYHIVNRSLKKIISIPHIVGGLIMIAILGSYYALYEVYNESTAVVPGLLDQSTQRTPFKHGIWKSIKHIIVYPFDNIFHFLPWSVLGVMFLRRDIWQVLKSNRYIHYLSVCFLANIIVYWISPGTYPRYILMLIPLIFTVLVYLYSIEEEGWRLLLLRRLYQGIIVAVPFIAATVIGLDEVPEVEGWQWKGGLLLTSLIGLAIIYFKDQGYRPFFIVMLVLILRIAFDWFVMPIRQAKDYGTIAKNQAIEIGVKYKNEKLGIYKNSKLDHTGSFYISTQREKILFRNVGTDDPDLFLIVDTSKVAIPENYEVVDTFRKREDKKLMQIVKRK